MNYLLSTGVEALRDLQQRQVATFSLSNVPSLPVRLGTVLVFLRPSAAIDEDMKVFTLPVLYTLAVLVIVDGCRPPDDSGWCGAGTFSGAPGELPGQDGDQATLRERPVGLVRSLLQIRQTLGPGDVDVEVLDVDVDLVRRRGRRLRSPDCPG